MAKMIAYAANIAPRHARHQRLGILSQLHCCLANSAEATFGRVDKHCVGRKILLGLAGRVGTEAVDILDDIFQRQ
jgi:hypothetical protein